MTVAVRWHVGLKGGDEIFETGDGCAGSQPLKWAGTEVVHLRWGRRQVCWMI